MTRATCCSCKNWRFRNNSANVANLLHPQTCQSPKAFISSICYCRKAKIPPQLFSKPKECQWEETHFKNYPNIRKKTNFDDHLQISQLVPPNRNYKNETRVRLAPGPGGETYRVASGDSGIPSTREQDHQPKGFNNARKLPRGSSTENLEATRAEFSEYNYDDFYTNKIDNYVTDPEDERDEKATSDRKYNTITSNSQFFTSAGTGDGGKRQFGLDPEDGSSSSPKSRLQEIADFRKDHFFETHSTEDLIKTVPDHVCVHKFGLDGRMLPESLNPDAYGTSRCIICGKAMENPKVTKSDERVLDKRKNVFPRYYKYGLIPRKIYMGGNDRIKIEINLDGIRENLELKCLDKPNYCETYALRYQKGVA